MLRGRLPYANNTQTSCARKMKNSRMHSSSLHSDTYFFCFQRSRRAMRSHHDGSRSTALLTAREQRLEIRPMVWLHATLIYGAHWVQPRCRSAREEPPPQSPEPAGLAFQTGCATRNRLLSPFAGRVSEGPTCQPGGADPCQSYQPPERHHPWRH